MNYPQAVGVITRIKPGRPKLPGTEEWLAMLTINFTDEKGKSREEDFPCKAAKASTYNIGDSINLVKILFAWHIHPDDRE